MSKERITWIDSLRAVAFFFVILGHMSVQQNFLQWIYSFHMPLFFIISGFTLNIEKVYNTKFKDWFSRLFSRIIVPYFWIEFVCLSLMYVFQALIQGREYDLRENIIGIFIGNGLLMDNPSRPLYFALVLFVAQLALWFIIRLTRKNSIALAAVAVAFSALSFLTRGKPVIWRVNVVPAAVLFIVIGTFIMKAYREIKDKLEDMNIALYLLMALCFFALGFAAFYFNGPLSMARNKYGSNLFVGVAGAVATSCFFTMLMIRLPKIRVLEKIGQNTFYYMGFHKFIIIVATAVFHKQRNTVLFNTVTSLSIFFGLLLFVLISEKLCPFMLCRVPQKETKLTVAGKLVMTFAVAALPYYWFLTWLSEGMMLQFELLIAVSVLLYIGLCLAIFYAGQHSLPFIYVGRAVEKKSERNE